MTTFSSMLLERKVITVDDLEASLRRQALYGGDLGTNLVEAEVLEEDDLQILLADYHELPPGPYGRLPELTEELTQLVPPEVIRRYHVYPLVVADGQLLLATMEALEEQTREDLQELLGSVQLRPVLVTPLRLREALWRHCGMPLPQRYASLLQRLEAAPPPITEPLWEDPPELPEPPEKPYRRMSEVPGGITLSTRRQAGVVPPYPPTGIVGPRGRGELPPRSWEAQAGPPQDAAGVAQLLDVEELADADLEEVEDVEELADADLEEIEEAVEELADAYLEELADVEELTDADLEEEIEELADADLEDDVEELADAGLTERTPWPVDTRSLLSEDERDDILDLTAPGSEALAEVELISDSRPEGAAAHGQAPDADQKVPRRPLRRPAAPSKQDHPPQSWEATLSAVLTADDSEIDAAIATVDQPKRGPEPEVELAPEIELGPEVDLEAELEAEGEVEPAPEIELGPEVDLEAELEAEGEVEPAPEIELGPEVDLEAELEAEPEPEPSLPEAEPERREVLRPPAGVALGPVLGLRPSSLRIAPSDEAPSLQPALRLNTELLDDEIDWAAAADRPSALPAAPGPLPLRQPPPPMALTDDSVRRADSSVPPSDPGRVTIEMWPDETLPEAAFETALAEAPEADDSQERDCITLPPQNYGPADESKRGTHITQPWAAKHPVARPRRDTNPYMEIRDPAAGLSLQSRFGASLRAEDRGPSFAADMFRHRGPLTRDVAELALQQVLGVRGALDVLFRYAQQFFDRTLLLVVLDDVAQARLSHNVALDLGSIQFTLTTPSVLQRAVEERIPVVDQLSRGGVDAVLRQLLRRVPNVVAVIPVILRDRAVALIYGDDPEGVDARSIADVSSFAEVVTAAMTRIISSSKQQ